MPSFESHPELSGLPRVVPPVQKAYEAAGAENPDQAAQVVDLTRKTGQPAPFVAAHLPQIQQALKAPPKEYWDHLEKEYPGTTRWLQKPQNMAVAHDDIETLSRQEQLVQGYSFGQELWKAAKKGGAGMAAGVLRTPAFGMELALTPGNLLAKAVGHPEWETHLPKEMINTREAAYWDKVVEANTTPANSADIVGMAGRGDIKGAARSLALQVISNAPNQALIIPATIAGAGVPALFAMGAISAGQAMKEGVDSSAGRTATTVNAALQGTFEGVTERFGTFGILKHWETALAKELGRKTAGEVVKATAKVLAYSGLGEGTEEAANTALGASAAAATGVNRNAYSGLAGQMANAFVIGAASGTGMTAPGAMISGRIHLTDVRRAEHAQNFYRALGDTAAASKLRQRLPAAYREQLAEMTKDGPVDTVHIPVEDAEVYFQSKKINPEQFMAELGLDPKVYAEAQETGTIQIPTAVWAEKVAGTEHYAALAEDVKFSVDSLTPREIKREEAAQQKLMQDTLAEVEKDSAAKQQVEDVRKHFYDLHKTRFAAVAERDYGDAKGAEVLETAVTLQSRFEAYLFASAKRRNPSLTVEEFLKSKSRGLASAQQNSSRQPAGALGQAAKNELLAVDVLGKKVAVYKNPTDSDLAAIRKEYATWFRDEYGVYPRTEQDKSESIRVVVDDEGNRYAWAAQNGQHEDVLSGLKRTEVSAHMSQDPAGAYLYQRPVNKPGLHPVSHMLMYQGANEPTQKVLDWTEKFANTPAPTTEDIKKFIREVMAAGTEFATLSPDWMVDIRGGRRTRNKIINAGNYKGLSPERRNRMNQYVADLEALLAGAKYDHEAPVDPSKTGKAHIAKYHYFTTIIKVGEKTFTVVMDTEQYKGESEAKPQTVHLYNISEYKKEPPGILAKRASSPGDNNSIADETPENKGGVLFQDEKRAAYDPVSRMSILGKTADASSVFHEMIHDWAEELHAFVRSGQADEAVLKDWAVLAKWLKMKKGQKKLTTEQHEKLARAGELYYREGQAPVEGLRSVFAKLRAWLTDVYREVSQLDVELTDDVRAVFGRMLAAEDEITRAELDLGLDSGEVSAALPPDLRTKIQAAAKEAHELAVQALLVQQMGELKPEWEAYVKNKREEAIKAFTVQVGELPLYRAIKAIEGQFPAMPVKDIARHVVAGDAPADVAYFFAAVGETQRFSSGDELAKRIISDPTLEEEVDGRLGEYMAQFEDLKNTTAIREWATRKIASQERLTIMAMEHSGLRGVPGANKQTSALERYRIEAAIARDKAHKLLSMKNVRNATNFRGFFAAEKRAAKQVVEAVYEKDFVRAAHFKKQEMTNHAMAAEALRNRAEVDKCLNRAEEILVKKVDLFKDAESFNQAAAILVKFGFGQHRAYNPALKRETLQAWAKRMDAAFGGVDENGNPVEGSGVVNIADWILTEQPGKPWRELTMSELTDVRDALNNILRAANIQDRAFALRDGAKISDMVLELIKGAEAHKKDNYAVHVIKEKDKGTSDYMNSLRRPEQVFNEFDGFKDGGVFQRTFEDPVHDAADRESRRLQEMKDRLEARWAAYSLQEKKDIFEREVFYEEAGTSMTKAHVLAMALNVGNQVNKEKLFGSTLPGIPWDTEWNEKAGMFFLQKYMTERDWDFVQGIWDDINTLWPDLAKTHEDITGFAPGKVDPLPFEVQVPGGPKIFLRGGYYPLAADTRFNEAAAVRELSASDPLHTELNPGYKAATRQGHSKARTQAQYAVSLDLGVITRHITDVVHDVNYRGLVYDLRRIVLNPDFANLIKRKMGQNGYWWFKNYVANVATRGAVNKVGTSTLARVVHWLNSRATTAMVIGRISVFVQNFANPFLAVGAVEDFGAGDVIRAMVGRGVCDYWVKSTFSWRKAEDMRSVVMEKSQFMRDRRETPDFSLADMRNTWGKNTDTLKELAANIGESPADTLTYVKEYSVGLIAGTDDMTNIPLWLSAYEKKIAADAPEAEAVRYADRLINRISGSGRKYDTARIFRGDDLERALSKLYSFWNVELNNWMRNTGQAWKGDAKDKAFFVGFLASRAMFAYLSAILVGQLSPFPGMDDDEDEATWWNKFIKTMLYPVNFFPGAREVVNIALDNALGLPTYGYRPAPFVGAAEKFTNLGKAVAGAAKGEKDAAQVAEAATSVVAITGIPFKAPLGNFVMTQAYPDQFNAWIWNAWDYRHNNMEPRPGDLMRRRPRRDR